MIRAALVLALLVAPASADDVAKCQPAAPKPPYPSEFPLYMRVMPEAWSHCLDGEVVGLLVSYTGKLDSIASFVEKQENGIYQLMMPGDAPRIVLFPDAKEGRASKARFDERRNHGVKFDVQLVKVRINDGKGSATNQDEIVASRIDLLDGTAGFPKSTSKLLRGALAAFEQPSAAWRATLRKAVNEATRGDVALEGRKRAEMILGAYRASWNVDAKSLHVVFYGRLTKTFSKQVKDTVDEKTYGAEYAIEFDVAVDGKQSGKTEHPVSVVPAKTEVRDPR